jgi:hypothetical protein
MAVTGITSKPEVVRYGGAREERYAYVDGEAFEQGDLIRLTTAGEIKLAEVDSSGAGAVHGIALQPVPTEVNEVVEVLLFAEDTVVAIQCVDTVAPEDLAKGQTYTLEYSSGAQGITATTTNGVATVEDYAATGTPWKDVTGTYDQDITENNNKVLVSFAQAILDGHAA